MSQLQQKRLKWIECKEIAEGYIREIKSRYDIPSKVELPNLVEGFGPAYIGSVRNPEPGVDYERDFCLIDVYEPKDPAEDGVTYIEILVNRLTGEPTLQYIRFPKKEGGGA
jgi:hypothetical protein